LPEPEKAISYSLILLSVAKKQTYSSRTRAATSLEILA